MDAMRFADYILIVLVLVAVFGGSIAIAPDLVAVVYESNDTTPLPYVAGALQTIQANGIATRLIDDDVLSGTGTLSDQMAAAIDAARSSGLPALVVMAGDTVKSVQPLPATAEQIVGVVQ